MTINWITVSAQAVNFLLLVWLLKRFLYQPVIGAMDRREARIAGRLSEADERERVASEAARRFEERRQALEMEREAVLARARSEAEAHKSQLLEKARAEALATRADWQREVIQEKEAFLRNLRAQAAQAVQRIARNALADLADAELEAKAVDRFIERLEALDRSTLTALAESGAPVRIVSAFELAPAVRSRLTRVVHERLAAAVDPVYAESPELLCGIELSGGGQRVGWTLADYMDELRVRIDDALRSLEQTAADE